MAALAGHLVGAINNALDTVGRVARGGIAAGEEEMRNKTTEVVENTFRFLGYDKFLEYFQNIYQRATDVAIQSLIWAIAERTLIAMRGYLGPAPAIWDSIMEAEVNKETFKYIQQNWSVLASFFVDLLEPTKRFCMANSTNGTPSASGTEFNIYNELDLTVPMNRHAVVCQLQRLAKSGINLFRNPHVGLDDFEMDTELESDARSDVLPMSVLRRTDQKPETWLFINGIAGETHWETLALEKLRDYFFEHPKTLTHDADKRLMSIKAIFNRSDGMLWDLLECAGERRPDGAEKGSNLNQRTTSSREAQKLLTKELQTALKDGDQDIVMIAHSQGCLLLRLSLEDLYDGNGDGARDAMRKRLLIFTFGNPSYDWNVHKYVKHTEHFANKEDFVAKLGVLRSGETRELAPSTNQEPYHCEDCAARTEGHPLQLIFVNENRKGHLFGAQYSLNEKEYSDHSDSPVERSWLLSRALWTGSV
jgi:hypothetical protein